ncbi:MAG: hypothetical protein IKA62_07795 [Clostridia bacterium]|nr:hypothetical protein [Clostridia bacterium]
MSKGISKQTKKLTLGAILSAMGVALLFLGSFIETLDLTMAALASFFCIFAVIELGGIYPWLIFSVTGVLSVILMPYSMTGWFYLLFFGYYPIVKEKLERLPKIFSWILKMLILNVALVIAVIAAYFLFFGQTGDGNLMSAFTLIFGESEAGEMMAIGVYALVNLTFVIYDIALTKLITLYFIKFRKKFKKFN